MFFVDEKTVEKIKETYTPGSIVELISMDDPYSKLTCGDRGTVRCVDDTGTVHVSWDKGGSLGLIYGEDEYRLIKKA